MKLTLRSAAMASLLTFAALGSMASTWPEKPMRMVVPFPAGGGTDIVARDVTHKLATAAKWSFVVDNKPGSGGNLGIDTAAKAAADGYTFVIGQTSNLAINATLYNKLPYNPTTDLTPIGLIGEAALVLVVSNNSPYRTLADVVKAAKAQPEMLNYATSGNGTVAHLATELLQREAGVKLTHVPYKGASQGLTDVIGGQVHLYMSSVPTLIGHIKSGKLRALAVTSLQRVDDLSQVPTVAESGYKGFDAVTWFGVLGPARLPASVVNSFNSELNKALNSPDLRKKLEDQGLTVKTGTPDQFGQLIRADIDKWGRVVKASGAKAD
ncbi:MAG: Bug family tripartite tricarboxylate transporter substrate binding protein [Limnohabitans sp.]